MNKQTVGAKSRTSAFLSLASVLLAGLVAVGGCVGRPLKGGRALTAPRPGGGLDQRLSQGDNPSQPSAQHQESIRVRTYTVPAGSRWESEALAVADVLRADAPHPALAAGANRKSERATAFVLAAPLPVTEREESRASTQLGAAQKDTAREVGARLASLRGIVWVGLGLFLFGLGTIFYAPLRAVIGSVTTSLALTLGGLALMVLPTLMVGHELLILGGTALAVALWFLAHRHGQLRGQVASLSQTQDLRPET